MNRLDAVDSIGFNGIQKNLKIADHAAIDHSHWRAEMLYEVNHFIILSSTLW